MEVHLSCPSNSVYHFSMFTISYSLLNCKICDVRTPSELSNHFHLWICPVTLANYSKVFRYSCLCGVLRVSESRISNRTCIQTWSENSHQITLGENSDSLFVLRITFSLVRLVSEISHSKSESSNRAALCRSPIARRLN